MLAVLCVFIMFVVLMLICVLSDMCVGDRLIVFVLIDYVVGSIVCSFVLKCLDWIDV